MVIAIIGLLAALLLAGIAQAKARALQAQCANNVRQLGVGLQAFVADYAAYPLTIGPTNGLGIYWMTVIQNNELSMLKGQTNSVAFWTWLRQGVWQCPTANQQPPWPTNRHFFSYGYNSFGISPDTATNELLGLGGHFHRQRDENSRRVYSSPVKENEVIDPTDMMAIGDGLIGGEGVVGDGEIVIGRRPNEADYSYPGSTKRSKARHRSHANVVFCDGHVEAPALSYLFDDTSDEALARWNRDHQPHR